MEHLSSSQINLYLQCSLKYRFRYIDELPRPFKSSGLAFGSAIHSALSWFHKEKLNGNGITLNRLYTIFEADWYCQTVDTVIRYKDGELEANLIIMGKELLGLYLQNPITEIKGTEIPFVIPFNHPNNGDGLGINLEGFIDLIEADDTIVEFKTSAQTMNHQTLADSLQLSAYSFAYEAIYQRPVKLFKIINFVKTKKPKMITLEAKRTKADCQRFYHLAGQVLKGIKQGVFFPRTGFWCGDCEYAGQCREWEGG